MTTITQVITAITAKIAATDATVTDGTLYQSLRVEYGGGVLTFYDPRGNYPCVLVEYGSNAPFRIGTASSEESAALMNFIDAHLQPKPDTNAWLLALVGGS